MLQHKMGLWMGRAWEDRHNKFRDPLGTHVSQRIRHVASDLRSANRNGSARPQIGGISNHKVDDSAANIDDHK